MAPPTPTLPDEILEEIFLRLPPDEPACLVRASLASKLWLSLLSGPSFQCRYREFHGDPPMLGFVYSLPEEDSGPLFVSTTKFGAQLTNDEKFDVLDCRHGRVLLGDKKAGVKPMTLLVCDPMTGYWRELSTPRYGYYDGHVAAVLCAVTGCDHRACNEGPFTVVFVGIDIGDDVDYVTRTRARVSSLQMDDWSEPCSHLDEWSEPCSPLDLAEAYIKQKPPLLVQDALYFVYEDDDDHVGILEYHLGSQLLALIDVPVVDTGIDCDDGILISMGDGSLGLAHVHGLTLNLWSRLVGSNGAAAWTHRTVINLENLLPVIYINITPRLIGSVEGRDIIFMNTRLGIYQINLKSLQWKKIWRNKSCDALFPYMRFYSRPGISLATPLYDFGTTLKYVIY
ncbi:hypothetical protein QYE76_021030 [Lolium multiflorum]|uniref:F-box domain-containing protein n=1 Tax=Lolium multiflorum TaxID=4521 RepID=A0AAD8VSR7_LOLMU|nr:hypothetical protein QYE76_021030 [Lolium multiflorum]